ncbi:MAG TPA: glycerol kinase GlpK, partial [Tepidiformaceae bacterium]
MPEPYILAIDQGTTSSRALVVDARGAVLGVGQHEFRQYYPRPGWVEHNPLEIWATTHQAMAGALAAAGLEPRRIAAIGVTNQRETIVLWDRRTGTPVAPAIVWQDRRSAEICDQVRDAGFEPGITEATGLKLDPYFSGTKLTWMLRENPELRARAQAGELAAGTIDSWIIWKLTNGARHVTDYTNACRTLLFNIHTGRWDDNLCGLLGIPAALLPEPQPSQSSFGTTDPRIFGAAVPITGVAGDQQSALFGQACFDERQAKNTYGTGCFLLANAGPQPPKSENRLLVSIGAGAGPAGPEYVLEGSVFVAGALVQWLRDDLGLFGRGDDIATLAASVPDSDGVMIVPAFTGLGAPDWDPYARGAILGLTRGSSKAHIARAALDAIALSSAELVGAMNRDLPRPIQELRVDGGGSSNDLMMQLQADYAGVAVIRPKQTETTAMGAAFLAGLGRGIWQSEDEVASLWRAERTFTPRMGPAQRAEALKAWRKAVGRTLGWASPG